MHLVSRVDPCLGVESSTAVVSVITIRGTVCCLGASGSILWSYRARLLPELFLQALTFHANLRVRERREMVDDLHQKGTS